MSRAGSSPRMRGTLTCRQSKSVAEGIIPAHAGNTFLEAEHVIDGRDHPRACGEHLFMSASCMVCWGSSPRMRGTR